MRRYSKSAAVLLALAALAPAVGCNFHFGRAAAGGQAAPPLLTEKTVHAKGNGPSTPEQDAILNVLQADRDQFKAGYDALRADSQPSALCKMIAKYQEHLEKTEAAGCPSQFRSARDRHAAAWQQLHDALSRLPDAYEGGEFMDALQALFHNSPVRGRSLGGDVIAAVEQVNGTYDEVYASAAGYGLAVETAH